MQLYAIHTGLFKLDGGAMFGVVPKSLWSKIHPPDENNLCTWAMRCLLIEDGDKLILVDNGIGDKQDARFFSHYYLHGDDSLDKSLSAHGFHRDDITDVLLTHLHFDHCGGSIVRAGDRLIPAFKNATYWSHSRHWKWATEPNDREKASFLKENILPIQESGQLRFVDAGQGAGEVGGGRLGAGGGGGGRGDGGDRDGRGGGTNGSRGSGGLEKISDIITPGLDVRLVYGHTDAMMLPQVVYKGRTLVFMADLLPSIGHFPIPYVMAYDMFPLTTLNEKKSFLEEAAGGNYVLFFEHDPLNECCVPGQTEKGIRAGKGFRLAEL
jgi:glyoxylase-like metal-dependent hydrolase (beta-lactamase superfamily II)